MDLRQDYHGGTYVFNENVGENMIQCNRGCGTDNLHWKIVNISCLKTITYYICVMMVLNQIKQK